MRDVRTQLSTYWTQVAADHPPPRADAIVGSRITRSDTAPDAPSTDHEERTMSQPTLTPRPATPPPGPRRARVALGLAAVGAVLAAVAVLAVGDDEGGPEVVGGTVLPDDAETALATANSLGRAVATHDADGALDLFSNEDLFFTATFAGVETTTSGPLEQYAEMLAWFGGQQAVHAPWNCRVEDPDAVSLVDGIAVDCYFTTSDALVRVTEGIPIARRTRIVVGTDGIRELEDHFGPPNPDVYEVAFFAWLDEQHPFERTRVDCCSWTSRDAATAEGRLRLQYAQEWADDLAARGCTLRFGQPLGPTGQYVVCPPDRADDVG